MHALPGQPVFTVGGVDYRWSDVVLAAKLWGEWDAVVERTRRGLARAAATDEDDDEAVSEEELNAAATEFRYARDLVTAEEMEAWLARWGLDVERWMAALENVLRDRRVGEEETPDDAPVPDGDEDLDEALLAEAVVSGDLERFAHRLAGRAAVFEKLKEEGTLPPADGGPGGIAGLEAAFQRFRDAVVTPATVEARVSARRAEWTRLACRVLSLPREEMAREARCAVLEDGCSLDEVAASAKTAVEDRRLFLDELDPAVRDHLWASRGGDLVGPLAAGDGFELYLVLEKSLPTPDDPEVRRKAEQSLLEGLVSREVDNRVSWRWKA